MKVAIKRSGLALLFMAAVASGAARAAITPAPTERLTNGVVLVARPDRTSPRSGFSLLLRCGSADEKPETAGWRRLAVNSMLRSLPKGYTAEGSAGQPDALQRASEKAGGSIGATVGADFVEFYGTGRSTQAAELLKLALAVIRESRLEDADIDAARDRLVEQINNEEGDPASRTESALRGRLYQNARGELTAYGLPESGTEDSLRSLTNAQIRDLVQKRLRPARLVVSVVGDVDVAAVRDILEDLPASHSLVPVAPFFAPSQSRQPALVVRDFPSPSAWVFVAYALLNAPPADAPALRVCAAALGDSSRARLPRRLLGRDLVDDPNAAITVAAQFTPRRYAGEMTLYAQTGPQGVESVKNALLDEVRKLKEGQLSPEELQAAKNYLRGSWAVERENLRDRAFRAALSPALGGPPDTSWPRLVNAVTGADVQRVARKYLNDYAVALVMPRN